MIIEHFDQGSDDWQQAHLGLLSASNFHNLITEKAETYSASASAHMNLLIAEQITGEECTGFTSAWMQRGIEMEEEARRVYSNLVDHEVEQVGLVYANDHRDVGCSPDGFTLSRSRGFECKCPSPQVFIKYLLECELPPEYKPQVQGSMLVTGCDEWDFMSFHPDFAPFILRIKRDDAYIKKLSKYVIQFNLEKNIRIEKLLKYKTGELN